MVTVALIMSDIVLKALLIMVGIVAMDMSSIVIYGGHCSYWNCLYLLIMVVTVAYLDMTQLNILNISTVCDNIV